MLILERIEKFIFDAPAWKFISLLFLIMLTKSGIWVMPTIGMSQAIAQNPFVNPFTDPNEHFMFWNWLGPFIAWLIGAKSRTAFFLLHFVHSVGFLLLFTKTVFSRFSDKVARTSLLMFSLLPVSITAFFWVGYDSFTLFLMMLALAFPRLAFLIGIGMGMQHFEQSFFGTAGLLFAVALSKKYKYEFRLFSVKFCVLLLLGVITGKLTLHGIFHYNQINVNSGRMHWLIEHLNFLLRSFCFHFHVIIWSVLGLGWLIALRFADKGKKTIPFFIALFGLLLLLPISGDHTRVLAIITFPLVAVFWLLNESFLEKITKREVATISAISVLLPLVWVWGGQPRWSVFPYNAVVFFHKVFGFFHLPADLDWWPFYSSMGG